MRNESCGSDQNRSGGIRSDSNQFKSSISIEQSNPPSLRNSNMEAVVLYTGSDPGHLIPMVALAKLLVDHGYSATIVTYDYPLRPGKANQEVSRLSSSHSSISFHVLPPVSLGDSILEPPAQMDATFEAQNLNLHNFLAELSKTCSVRAIMLSIFCGAAVDVAKQLSIPAYFYTAFGASATAFFLHLLELDKTTTLSLKDFGENLTNFPGLPPVQVSDFPVFFLDRESDFYKLFMKRFPNIVKSDGILMNTFDSLESKAIGAMREGCCAPSFQIPPVYSIGPLVTESREKERDEQHECLRWLDAQPKGSVVYLCFGSMGGFQPDQIKCIATGLENSGRRFLWVVKIGTDPKNIYNDSLPGFGLDEVLPEGFLDRTKDQGMVIETWAPQIEVLRHEAVGGFVTHCGWNSILEAVTTGVPMVCWPLYAEQRLNKDVLVEEMRLGVAMEGYDGEMVEAEEVEAKVRWLMEAEGGRELKERAKEMKDKAAESLTESGPSSQAFMQFLRDLKGLN